MLPHNFVLKVILACHDDNGHLGMERTLGLLQERDYSFGSKWGMMCLFIFVHVINAPGSSNPKKELECDQYWFLILWSGFT